MSKKRWIILIVLIIITLLVYVSKVKDIKKTDFNHKKGIVLKQSDNEILFKEDGFMGAKEKIDLKKETVIIGNRNKKIQAEYKFQEGEKIEVYFRKKNGDKIQAEAIVLNENTQKNLYIRMDYFDRELKAKYEDVYLKPDKDLIIYDRSGNLLVQDIIYEKDLLVFYEKASSDLPENIIPELIIVMSDLRVEDKNKVIINNKAIKLKNEIISKNGIDMIPIEELAEELGYKVEKTPSRNIIELIKGPSWHRIELGKNQYNFARMNIVLEKEPIKKDGQFYVPLSFLDKALRLKTNIKNGVLTIEF